MEKHNDHDLFGPATDLELSLMDQINSLRAAMAHARSERDAAMIEVNDLRMSGSLLANQLVCTCGGGLSKLLGCLECGTRYELISSDRLKRITDKLRVYEIAGENAPPFSSSSFEAVSDAIAQRDAATRRAEQAEEVYKKIRSGVLVWCVDAEMNAQRTVDGSLIIDNESFKNLAALAGPEVGERNGEDHA